MFEGVGQLAYRNYLLSSAPLATVYSVCLFLPLLNTLVQAIGGNPDWTYVVGGWAGGVAATVILLIVYVAVLKYNGLWNEWKTRHKARWAFLRG